MHLKTILFVIMLLGLFLSAPEQMDAQESSRKIRQSEKRLERVEQKNKRDLEKQRAKQIQEHINRQSPEVQERMKQNIKDSRQWGRHKQEPFYKRWYRKISNLSWKDS